MFGLGCGGVFGVFPRTDNSQFTLLSFPVSSLRSIAIVGKDQKFQLIEGEDVAVYLDKLEVDGSGAEGGGDGDAMEE